MDGIDDDCNCEVGDDELDEGVIRGDTSFVPGDEPGRRERPVVLHGVDPVGALDEGSVERNEVNGGEDREFALLLDEIDDVPLRSRDGTT